MEASSHSTDDLVKLAMQVGQRLQACKWQLATAESCTGGMVAAAITDIAGSSAWFDRGFVTYSNQAKTDLLGVSSSLIENHGAVSETVAQAMAAGALAASQAHIALSVTGIAGPGGGSPLKPVGMVCFAWTTAQRTHQETCHFKGNRQAVRLQAALHTLQTLLLHLPD